MITDDNKEISQHIATCQNPLTSGLDPLQTCFTEILQQLGEDLTRDGLVNTPRRAAKALRFLTRGYFQTIEEIINGAIFDSNMDEMVLVKNIELYSLCEHHLLPFIGKCHVAYIPNGKIIGLSKVARIIDHFARRLQVQEKLTQQIAECILEITQAKGVGVIIEAKHLCMMMRGVEKQNSIMKTSMMLGLFRTHSHTRTEFLTLASD
jgi:GTP cyclohydrolase I